MEPMDGDDPLKRVLSWIATAATLGFATIGLAAQNDPRLPALFDRLEAAPSAEAAAETEQAIWAIWHLSGTEEIDRVMAVGLHAMARRDFARALTAFETIVERAPDFAEGWNKRATLYYLMGRFEDSKADIERTLALEPRHFGALSGLGLVHLALDEEDSALAAFDRALEIHPNMAGADTHIRALRDKLRGRRI